MRTSRARLMTSRCKVLRANSNVAGKSTGLAVILTDVDCTPLMPISSETALRAGIETPAGRSVLYVSGDYEIRNGDVVDLDGKELSIVAASRLPDRFGGDTLELIVQTVKTERY